MDSEAAAERAAHMATRTRRDRQLARRRIRQPRHQQHPRERQACTDLLRRYATSALVLAGGATDTSAGPLLALSVLASWPIRALARARQ